MEVVELQVKEYSFEELLKNDGFLVYTNVGISMMPLLRQRKDVVEIRPVSGRCKKYDVVLYKRGSLYILHRILKVTPTGYVIAGDNNTCLETDIRDDEILGVMTRVIRNGKQITPDNIIYRMYIHLWCDFFPIRVMILHLKQKIKVLCKRLQRD